MSIEVSVIMISYNKYPQNLYSLYALENQTFDAKKMEVILVDDASTDQTPKLRKYRPPFKFRYLRCPHNVGRAKAKNVGIASASGEVLIIIDAEMILDPDYVKQHYALHQREENLVVTGCLSRYNTFTILDRRYNPQQLKKFSRLYQKAKKRRLKISPVFKKRTKIPLFQKKHILQRKYEKFAYHAPTFASIIKRFGTNYEGFYMPYIFVITQNISLRRSAFDLVGPFDEGFKGWGCEDWEFGYRLYKQGMKIMDNPHVKVYHQEHPRNVRNQNKDSLVNYLYFYRRHPEFDVGVQCLCWIGVDFFGANDLIIEYNAMIENHPHEYPHLVQSFHILFEVILTLLSRGQKVENLRLHSKPMNEELWMQSFAYELNLFRSSWEYPKLISLLGWLINK